ncbi:Proline dehydrogenase [Mycena kentingensis (nom. inval.)]|nr:Proline dehydrogenase [Mycena kentingensis (nom. inval.)]
MASLLERMSIPANGAGAGPVRSKSNAPSRKSSPYGRPPKGDADSAWSHDMFESHNSLSARMNITPTAPKVALGNGNGILGKALLAATGPGGGLSIKGASTSSKGNVVEVTGLVSGTSADDVAAIFKRCGEIVKTASIPGPQVTIRVTFKTPAAASAAVSKFDGQPADGKTLSVRVVGTTAAGTSLGGRLGGLVRDEGSVDVLMESADSGSKMRSDSLTTDPRAQVLVAPPGANPKDYVQGAPTRGRGGRGRARGGGRRGGAKRGGRMDVD